MPKPILHTQPAIPPLRIVIVGHVDHGKSTLVGRLIHDTGALPDGKFEQITQSCKKRGVEFEWAFLMDALQAERDQNVTIETTQIRFRHKKKSYVLIDAPGHREFLKNMITGAAQADAALLLVDAGEGVREQTKRHAYLLHLMGIRQVAVLINKMDKIGYDKTRFDQVSHEVRQYLAEIDVTASAIIPVSSKEGDMIAKRGKGLGWYEEKTVLETLAGFSPIGASLRQPLRLPVQDVYKWDGKRIAVGRIESGALKAGQTVLLSPTNHTVKVAEIITFPPSKKEKASAGESVGITFEDQFFLERGHMISDTKHPPMLSNQLKARIFWLSHQPLEKNKRIRLRLGTAEYQAEIKEIYSIIDTDTLEKSNEDEVGRNQVAEVLIGVRGLASLDEYALHPATGRFVLVDESQIMGGGIISLDGIADQRVKRVVAKSANIADVDLKITPEQRAHHNGHTGGILWFTGLSGSGKSTLAMELQQRLFAKGYQVYVLDGDNIRQGLCADLGFSHKDRTENIRRVGEVAALFAKAGFIVITAFISPYKEDRRRARAAAPEYFHTIHIKADVDTCEQRDVKGLYKKARAGKIPDFTGVSAPYEAPENPELVIDTKSHSIDNCAQTLLAYVEREFKEFYLKN